jgi:hypothetical protein
VAEQVFVLRVRHAREPSAASNNLRRYSDAWFAAAKHRKDGDVTARFPRRKRRLVPVRFRYGTFTIEQRRVRLATARGCRPLCVRLGREAPYPGEQVRSLTLLNEGRRLFVEVTAEVPIATYEPGCDSRHRDLAGGANIARRDMEPSGDRCRGGGRLSKGRDTGQEDVDAGEELFAVVVLA